MSILSCDYKTQILACLTEGMSIRRTERKRADNPGNKAFMLEMSQSWIRLAEQAKEKDDSGKGTQRLDPFVRVPV